MPSDVLMTAPAHGHAMCGQEAVAFISAPDVAAQMMILGRPPPASPRPTLHDFAPPPRSQPAGNALADVLHPCTGRSLAPLEEHRAWLGARNAVAAHRCLPSRVQTCRLMRSRRSAARAVASAAHPPRNVPR